MVWIFLLSELVWWCRPCRQVRDGRLDKTEKNANDVPINF